MAELWTMCAHAACQKHMPELWTISACTVQEAVQVGQSLCHDSTKGGACALGLRGERPNQENVKVVGQPAGDVAHALGTTHEHWLMSTACTFAGTQCQGAPCGPGTR